MRRGHRPSDDHPWKNLPIKKKLPKDLEDYYAVLGETRKKKVRYGKRKLRSIPELNSSEVLQHLQESGANDGRYL